MKFQKGVECLNIYLIGFMGSGKSSVGKLLAKNLNYKFIDTDEEIEKDTGLSINEIFKKFGERYFRNLERKKLEELIKLKNLVVATGGGMGADEKNINLMKQSGLVVWLKIDFDTFLKRVGNDPNRPLLKEDINKLKTRFIQREKYYSKADIIIDATKELDTIMKNLMKKIEV